MGHRNKSIVGLVILFFILINVQADWFTDPEWSFQVYLNADYTVHCNDSVAAVSITENTSITWIKPNKLPIPMGDSKYQLEGNPLGMSLKIKNVQLNDSGMYYCMVKVNNQLLVKINRGLNLYGHLERTHFNLYRANVIVAFVSAIVFLVSVVGLCLLQHFRYRTEDEKLRIEELEKQAVLRHKALKEGRYLPTENKNGQENRAFEMTTDV
ncbi:hypothetical protein SNE40_016440 [Patella caerulea]|uniref:Ig-like domain-containing protein n=1 Tax=Patella caerulea TaxID=87958 RepID=A0AAN8JDP1_PATCE